MTAITERFRGIVDAHHHLWDPAARDYPWMAGEALAPLRRRFGVAELRDVAGSGGVVETVVVQAVSSEEETEALLAAAESAGGLIAGVVGWVDLVRPDVEERVARLRSLPGGERLVGVRHQVHDEPDTAWLLHDDVLRGLAAVAAAGLRYDLLLRPPHLPAALAVARRLPSLVMVVDHGAKPSIATGEWEPWSGGLAALAGCPNVYCKLSGLVTEARWDHWRSDGVERYGLRLLELFGPERLMWGSDWPVCELAASYEEVLSLARGVLARAGIDGRAREAVFAGTARRFYGLEGG